MARKPRSITIPGNALFRVRAAWNLTQDEFAKALGVSRAWVQQREGAEIAIVDRSPINRIAELVGWPTGDVPGLLHDIAESEAAVPPRVVTPENEGIRVVATGRHMPAFFKLGIAASGWSALRGEGWSANELQAADGWVIVQVSGDSMEPRWKNRSNVLFRRLNLSEDSPEPGVDYFVIRNDAHGTFKRLAAIDEDGYVFRALNGKYPNPMRVSRDQVVMIAEARFTVEEPPDV
ncbi:MAG: S24 family peptidase [Tepidisphaeraceae bacterium]